MSLTRPLTMISTKLGRLFRPCPPSFSAVRVPSQWRSHSRMLGYFIQADQHTTLALSPHSLRLSSFRSMSSSDTEGNDDIDEDSGSPLVVVEKLEKVNVMVIGLNRPKKRNSVNEATAQELFSAFQDFEHDENMKTAVLHGLGGNFCAGYDLQEISKIEDDVPNKMASLLDRGPMGPTRMEFSKPVIAAVSGWAVAGGLELALMCDMRIIEEDAKIGVLCRRFGVPLIDGGTVRLPELIGLSRAMDMILTGRIVSAKEALDFGIANRLVNKGTALGYAVNLAREIGKFPQECLRADRKSTYYSIFASKSLEDSLQYEIENGIHIVRKESIEGAAKFVKGLGKHGKYNVNPIPNRQDWEVEYEKMQLEEEQKKDRAMKEKDQE